MKADWYSIILGASRVAVAMVVVGLSFMVSATLTTDGWYFTEGWWIRSLQFVAIGSLVTLVLFAPISWLPFASWSRRLRILGMVAISFLPVVSAEIFGRAQEWNVIRQYGLTPSERVHVDRWWPFEHHEIEFQPGYGWCGWD